MQIQQRCLSGISHALARAVLMQENCSACRHVRREKRRDAGANSI